MGDQSGTSSQDTASGRRVLIALRTSAGFAVLSLLLSLGGIGDRVGDALWKALFVLVWVLLLTLAADRIGRVRRAHDEPVDESSR